MKTAVIYHFFPHYRAAVLRALLRSKENDYVLVADDRSVEPSIKRWDIEERQRFQNAPCRVLPGLFRYQSGLIRLALRRDLKALIFLGNPYFLATWVAASLGRLTGKRVLFWTHGWNREESGIKAWIRKLYYRIPHGLLLYGHMAKMAGIAKGFPPEKLYVIYNSLDYERQKTIRQGITAGELSQVRSQFFERPDLPLVVCSARLNSECRFDLLLEAQHQMCQAQRPFNLLLIGDGPERERLEARAQKLNLPVRFHGACYEESELAKLIMAAQVTVSPGKVGLTAMHSMAYGTPVISHDDWQSQGPEWESILQDRTGDFFKVNDVQDLARVIHRWTYEPQNRSAIQADCFMILEKMYNAGFQRRAIDRAVNGRPADDLFWMKEAPAHG